MVRPVGCGNCVEIERGFMEWLGTAGEIIRAVGFRAERDGELFGVDGSGVVFYVC